MKLLLGIIIGAVLILSMGKAYADNIKEWDTGAGKVLRIQDGIINCYMVTGPWQNVSSISCLKTK